MTTSTPTLAKEYSAALQDFLAGSGEPALHRAYELGRRVIADGLSLLELVSLHHQALQQGLRRESAADERLFPLAQTFLAEVLSPFELGHREFQGAITALRQLNQRLEDEAHRIAQGLHDEAGQLLVTVHLALGEMARDYPLARGRLQDVRTMLDEVEQHLRRLSHELRPAVLDDLGLMPALDFLARGVSARSGIPIDVRGPSNGRLPPPIEVALYRIVAEALTNASRHSRARQVMVTVTDEPDAVRCIVRDDGVGFDAAPTLSGASGGGLGLIGMRERLHALGGQLNIRSMLGHGTELMIDIPLGADHASASTARR